MHPITPLMTLSYQHAVNCLLHGVNKKGHPTLSRMPSTRFISSFQEETLPFLQNIIPILCLPCKIHRIKFNL
jgi:hypothetical protein